MGTDRHAFVVVANRLPVDRIDGAWEASPGGLVSAVAPVVREQAGAWVGWANTHDDSLEPFDFDGMSLVPVSLSHDEHQQYYEGFCNATLWPLHHDLIVAPQYHRSWWRAYREVNARFAQAAVEAARATAETVARRGRASYVGDVAKGVIDPGAAAMALVLGALRAAVDGEAVDTAWIE